MAGRIYGRLSKRAGMKRPSFVTSSFFGSVLYEMFSERAFRRATIAETITAILKPEKCVGSLEFSPVFSTPGILSMSFTLVSPLGRSPGPGWSAFSPDLFFSFPDHFTSSDVSEWLARWKQVIYNSRDLKKP
jgi:hypothetical protein